MNANNTEAKYGSLIAWLHGVRGLHGEDYRQNFTLIHTTLMESSRQTHGYRMA